MKDAIQKLDTALVQLLQTKSEQEITISDLCEQAQMDRNNFYNCYNDLSDLETAFCQRTEAQALQVCHTATDFLLVFHYIKEYTDVFTAYFKLPYSGKHSDYKMLFFCNGAYSVAKLWFQEGCQESPEQMGELLKREYQKIVG